MANEVPADAVPKSQEAAAAKPVSNGGDAPATDPESRRKFTEARDKLHRTFGQVVLALSVVSRYRHQTLADLESIILRPLTLDRVAMATTVPKEGDAPSLTGIAIWASVSEEVDAKIREQVGAGVFPVRLKSDEWTSGDNNWLLDIVAPNPEAAMSVIGSFRQVVKGGRLNIHPSVVRALPKEAADRLHGMRSNDGAVNA